MSISLDLAAREVLRQFLPKRADYSLIPLGNRGGFSGARIWRIEVESAALCLRQWPARQSDPNQSAFIHKLMAQAHRSGLAFVPALIRTNAGRSAVEHAGRLWDLATWLPGHADFHAAPSNTRLENAGRALARLHDVWRQPAPPSEGVCPAVRRRLAAANEWLQLRRSGWQPDWKSHDLDPVRPVAERAWRLIDERVTEVESCLRPWANRVLRLHPCLCDVWHDHLLFVGDELTGLVDYGASKVDHPAVDLARMLGSLVPDDPAAWEVGLRGYRAIRPFAEQEVELALALDQTGTILGAANWLRWLFEENRHFEDRDAVARRVLVLVERMERWKRA